MLQMEKRIEEMEMNFRQKTKRVISLLLLLLLSLSLLSLCFHCFVCLNFNYTDFQAANDPNENDIINLDPIVFRNDAVAFPTHRTELRRTKRINGPFTRRR